jgi:peptidoglycan/LPS O-acetylase OafA/YrhL
MLLTRFRRVTRDGRWIPEIDGLRFVAIISVLLFHLLGELQNRSGRILPVESRYSGLFWVISSGGSGVSLFFIISGFVLALPFARHHLGGAPAVSLRKYFMRRVTRLEPPYLLSVLLFVALLALYSRHFTADLARHAAVTAVYLHSLVYDAMTPINPVSWSLEVEVQFYILAPLVMLLYRIRQKMVRRAVMAALIVAISLAQYPLVDSPRASLSILFYAQFFLMGLLMADLYIVDGDAIRPSLLWDAAGVLGLAVSFGAPRTFVITHIAMPWAMAFIFLAALRGVVLRRFFANSWVATIGGMCYSIYLIHFQMIAVLFKFTRHFIVVRFDLLANYAIQIVVTAVPVLLVSSVFFLLIERPCMDPNWPSRFWHRISGRSRSEAIVFDSGVVSE